MSDILKEDNYQLGEHSFSWLSLEELIKFNYENTFELNNKIESFKEMLGEDFFRDIDIMKKLDPNPANIRVVFGFDS